MKKFLLLSLFAAFVLLAKSQDFTVMAGADVVKDGGVIEVSASPEIFGDYAIFEWNPQLSAKCSGDELEVAVTISTDDEGFTICWPQTCFAVTPGTPKVTEGMLYPEAADLQIHCMLNMPAEEASKFKEAIASVSVQPVGGKKMSFTLVCRPGGSDAVETISAASEEIGIFDLTGRKLSRRQPGINLILHSDGRLTKELTKL